MKKFKLSVAAIAVSTTLCASGVWATNGMAPVGVGQSAKGAGGAGVAYPQDTLSIGINPAGIVKLGNRLDAGLELFRPDRSLTFMGQSYDGNETSDFWIPEFGYTRTIDEKSSWGIAVFGNGGMNTDYKFHPLTRGPAMINLEQLFIAPTYAAMMGKESSFGVSLVLAAARFEAKGLEAFKPNSAYPENLTGNGDSIATGQGIRFGFQSKLSDTVTVGATYQTKIRMGQFDEYKGLFPDGRMDIPENFAIGLAYEPMPRLAVLLDIMQVNYKGTGTGNSTHGDGMSPLGFPAGPGFGWDNQQIFKLGLVYQATNDLTLRFGLNHGKNPVPNESFNDYFFNSLAPGITEDHVTLGATYAIDEEMSITASYIYTDSFTLKGNGVSGGSLPPGMPAGDLKMSQQAFGLGFNWKF